MSVSDYYHQSMQREGYEADDAQLEVVHHLDRIAQSLCAPRSEASLLHKMLGSKPAPVRGMYLWGGVGRGKTFLMDAFFEALPIEEKLRLHFHRFMVLVHSELHEMKKSSSALKKVARKYSDKYRVMCLDEMHITDEGDAAIMEGLLVNMLEQGMTLITTSNRAPEDLTHDPNIQRLFRTAVDAMNTHLDIVNLDIDVDYRLRHIEHAEIWHSPLDNNAYAALDTAFRECQAFQHQKKHFIVINDRKVPVVKWDDGVVWFDFDVICGPPRARIDYIEIARFFHSVLIQNVPILHDQNNDYARRFNLLIDELYDHNVKMFVSSDVTPHELYKGTRLEFEFQRTLSRILEMQSHEYLAREHAG